MPRLIKISARAVMAVEKPSQFFHSYRSRTRGPASSISPAVMGISRNSIPRRESRISPPISSRRPAVERRLISGKITLVTDSTRMPAIMV